MFYLIYSETQRIDAEAILRFLTEEKQLTIYSQDKDLVALQSSDEQITRDCAIILISNAAVEDEKWQMLVAGIPEDVRIIPVNCSLDAENMDPARIPAKVKEINYINMDGKQHENIWEALTTEDGFYAIKNMLLLNKSAWLFARHSEDFLLTDQKSIKEYLLIFQKKLQAEKDPYFQEELNEILDFLKISMQYSKKMLRRKITDYIKRAIAVIVAAVCLVFFFKIYSLTERLKYTNAVIGIGSSKELSPINAIKLVDGITNPFIPIDMKAELYNILSENLNENWSNSTIGLGYKWYLNDAWIASDERYIWSANSDGNIAKWDTYTGQILEQTNVSSQSLVTLAVSENEDLFVAVDFDGYLFKRRSGGPWEQSPVPYDISFFAETKLDCIGEPAQAILKDASGKLMWFDLQNGFDLIWEWQTDKIFCAELTGNVLETVVSKNSGLYDLFVHADGTVEQVRIPIEPDSTCSMDIRNGTVVMSDSHFQIVTWTRTDPSAWSPAGIVLSRPYYLCFLNDQVIVYNDRNTGTHLYDLKRCLDLGSILDDAAVISSLSASSNTVMAASQVSVYSSENVESLLPLDQLNRDDVCTVYTGEEMSSSGMIQQVSIENEDRLHIVFRLEDGSIVPFYMDQLINFLGKPTAAGIGHDGEVLLIGCADGSFYEIIFSDAGTFQYGAQRQIPSHAAIKAINQTTDGYYLEDVTGTFWRVRIGYDALTPDGAVAAVKERLHCAATEEIYETVSKDTLKALDVVVLPGGGIREWE